MKNLYLPAGILLLSLSACSDVEGDDHDHHGHDHEHEFFTTVRLNFASDAGDEFEANFVDLQDGENPSIDDIYLTNGETYTLSISFLNELEDPAEDITPEIRDEEDEHQVFIYGDAVDSAATAANDDALVTSTYLDSDSNGMDLGLENEVTAIAAGSGTFSVMLRHMPLQNGETVKTADLAADFAAGGSSALPGATDIDVSFTLNVE